MSVPSNKKEAAKAWLKGAWQASRALATNKSRLEVVTLEALGDETWGPTGAQMNEISEACFDVEKFRQVWAVILFRFESEPAQWRRVYKALLLTEHLIKTSSQHVVQTVIDAAVAVEALRAFKYTDDKGKDHGINVSNRAKELALLLNDPERIRTERAKAKALREKLRGAGATSASPSAGGSSAAASPARGPAASAASDPGLSRGGGYAGADRGFVGARLGLGGDPASASGSPRPTGRRALPGAADSDEREDGSGGAALGYGAAPPVDDPMAATARRIDGLRQAGLVSHASLAAEQGAGASGSTGARSSSQSDLEALGRAQPAKPSLHELMARKSAGPKRLQEVAVNPAIATAFSKPSGISPAGKLAPPPSVAAPSPAAAAASGSPSHGACPSAAALAELLTAPAPTDSPQHSRLAAGGSAPASPWSTASPSAAGGASFDAFGSFAGPGSAAASPSAAAAARPADFAAAFGKPGAPATVSLTASASPHALPAYLFSEPVPAAGAWGAAGAGAPASPGAGTGAGHGHGTRPAAASPTAAPKAEPAADFFADFNPLRAGK